MNIIWGKSGKIGNGVVYKRTCVPYSDIGKELISFKWDGGASWQLESLREVEPAAAWLLTKRFPNGPLCCGLWLWLFWKECVRKCCHLWWFLVLKILIILVILEEGTWWKSWVCSWGMWQLLPYLQYIASVNHLFSFIMFSSVLLLLLFLLLLLLLRLLFLLLLL